MGRPPPRPTLFPYTTLFRSTNLTSKEAKMGKVMRHTLGIPAEPLFRSEERFSRNAETDLVCRLLLEKKKNKNKLATILVMRRDMPAAPHYTNTDGADDEEAI